MFDLSRLIHSALHRARVLRGLWFASSATAATGFVVSGATVALRLLTSPLPVWALSALLGAPLAAGALAFVIGRATHPQILPLLLRIDDVLGLHERVSALYELRQRGGTSALRTRLENGVLRAASAWREALPVARRTLVAASVGSGCLLVAAAAAFAPLPRHAPSALPSRTVVTAPAAPPPEHPRMTSANAPPGTSAARDPMATERQADATSPDGPNPFDETLRDLSQATQGDTVVSADGQSGPAEMARERAEALHAMTEFLESVLDRLEAATSSGASGLTEDEAQQLRQQLAQGGLPPELRAPFEGLLGGPEGEDLAEAIEQLLAGLSDEAPPDEADGSPPSTTAVAPDPSAINDLLDRWSASTGAEPPAGDGSGLHAPASPAPSLDQEDRSGAGTDTASGLHRPSSDEEGGADSLSDLSAGEEGALETTEPEFLREAEVSRLGSEGDFLREFLTKGVPVEVVDAADADPTFRVDYERMASVMRARGVPEGAIDIVRAYFSAITEGGS